LGLFEPIHTRERDVGSEKAFGLYYSLQTLHANLVEKFSVFIIHMDLSALGADEELLGGGRPADEFNLEAVFLAPLPVSLNASNDDVAVLIGDAYFGSIGAPLHVLDD
jgi:hypothetical protein